MGTNPQSVQKMAAKSLLHSQANENRSEPSKAAISLLRILLSVIGPRTVSLKDDSEIQILGLVWSGLVWSGLVWSGLVWSGLVWSGLVWSGLVWSGLVWSGLVWSGLVWSGLVNHEGYVMI